MNLPEDLYIFQRVFVVRLQFEDFLVENEGQISATSLLEEHGEVIVGNRVFGLQIDCHCKLVCSVVRSFLVELEHAQIHMSCTTGRIEL
jgi:hypothetical protein